VDQAFLRKLLEWYSQPNTGHLPPVQTAEANVYGLRGLHGMVWEWVHDFNSTMIAGESRGDGSLERKLFCGSGSLLAGDVSNYAAFMRYALRSSLQGNYCIGSLGFRTAASIDAKPGAISGGEGAGASAYDLKGLWRTQDNRKITLGDLKGKPRVLTMGFTSCQYACPRIVSDIKRIEAALGSDAANVGFVFVSIDPVRDTPGALAAFAAERKLEPARWTLLNGPAENVRELAVALAFKYQQVNEDFAHSNMIVVLDAGGNVVHRTEELDADISASVAAVKKLLAAP
jgi:cytochrome oxidase Cu insertion factor (SCO1/SenC/PrrC family)